jgi:AbrB family looped-hinge helix DNA binding protein
MQMKQPDPKACDHLLHTVSVGSRGQIVIPQKIRKHFNIKPGDQMLLFSKDNEVIGLSKLDTMEHMISHLQGVIDQMKNKE